MANKAAAFLISLMTGVLVAAGVAGAAEEKNPRPFVRLSYVPGSAALPVLVGIERGFFQREGLTVSALPVVNQRAIVNSLARGYTDFATGSQSWLLDMARAKAPVKVLALSGYGREMELVVPIWDKKTSKITDLKDKAVLIVRGTHNFDAVPEFYRILAFSRMPLSSVDVRFIDLNELSSVFDPKFRSTYLKRKVGGILTYTEYTRSYKEKKLARTVMSNEAITKLIGRISARPLLANAAFVKNDPATVQKFVTAWVKTMKYISENQDDAATVLAIYYGRQYGVAIEKKEAREIVALTQYDRVRWTDADIKGANINAKAISAGRDILFASIKDPKKRPFKTAPKIDDHIDNRFVDKALAELEAKPDETARTPDKSGDPNTTNKATNVPADRGDNEARKPAAPEPKAGSKAK